MNLCRFFRTLVAPGERPSRRRTAFPRSRTTLTVEQLEPREVPSHGGSVLSSHAPLPATALDHNTAKMAQALSQVSKTFDNLKKVTAVAEGGGLKGAEKVLHATVKLAQSTGGVAGALGDRGALELHAFSTVDALKGELLHYGGQHRAPIDDALKAYNQKHPSHQLQLPPTTEFRQLNDWVQQHAKQLHLPRPIDRVDQAFFRHDLVVNRVNVLHHAGAFDANPAVSAAHRQLAKDLFDAALSTNADTTVVGKVFAPLGSTIFTILSGSAELRQNLSVWGRLVPSQPRTGPASAPRSQPAPQQPSGNRGTAQTISQTNPTPTAPSPSAVALFVQDWLDGAFFGPPRSGLSATPGTLADLLTGATGSALAGDFSDPFVQLSTSAGLFSGAADAIGAGGDFLGGGL